jgi:Asp-tRNA(Asn)/Glu-tRNA(Gln) amidotransferase A subunit family amidase
VPHPDLRLSDERSVNAHLRGIAAPERGIRALLDEPGRRGRVRAEVAAVDPSAPLAGMPVGVKDVIHVDGFDTLAGSSLPAGTFLGPEATSVALLRDAGAVVLAKTVTTEFAYAEPGPTTNPHDPTRTPGGSSSGSAAAVAAGFVPLALGTQTVDSVTTPAAYCGVVGFKPTFGRIPGDGVVPFSPSMDTVGVLAADIATARLGAAALIPEWSEPRRIEGPRLLVPDGPYLDIPNQKARRHFEAVLNRLERAGAKVKRTRVLGDIAHVLLRHRKIVATEFARVHEAWFEAYGGRYSQKSHDLVEEGRRIDADVPTLMEQAGHFARRLTNALQGAGSRAWVAPSAVGIAPRRRDIGDPSMSVPWTHAHLPTVTLPSGTLQGMPLGIQLAGRPDDDERLLSIAAEVEEMLAG